ncbi:ABC transporter substrate-binding protein [Actinomycetaceae bacterium TAE3-ERU4]|nr:ABC transporter substrate-binding protein [Actinomycetaceae bacterium TAE3-ERU4]
MKKILPITAALCFSLSLTACSAKDPDQNTGNTTAEENAFNVENIKTDDSLFNALPKEIKDNKVLKVGTSADYEPAEYLSADGKTALGFDMDIIRAIAKKTGLKAEITNAPFDSIIPAVGAKYNVAISSFDISPERLTQVNMTSYMKSGALFMTKKGNPKNFNPAELCGMKIGVQSGTSHQSNMEKASKECTAQGKTGISILPETDAQMLAIKLDGNQLDAIMVDNITAAFTSKKNPDKFQTVGEVQNVSFAGIITAKADTKLAEVITKATTELIKDGTIGKIFENWKVDSSSLIDTAVLNPEVK